MSNCIRYTIRYGIQYTDCETHIMVFFLLLILISFNCIVQRSLFWTEEQRKKIDFNLTNILNQTQRKWFRFSFCLWSNEMGTCVFLSPHVFRLSHSVDTVGAGWVSEQRTPYTYYKFNRLFTHSLNGFGVHSAHSIYVRCELRRHVGPVVRFLLFHWRTDDKMSVCNMQFVSINWKANWLSSS